MRVAIYARVSTSDQDCSGQLFELRAYAERREWQVTEEFVDHGISGAKTARPALDRLVTAAKRRQIDGVLVWRLDRLGRSTRHLLGLVEDWQAIGVSFTSLGEAIDTTTPAGKLQLAVLGALAEFERERIRERVTMGLERARRQGVKLGRRRNVPLPDGAPRGLTVRQAAKLWGCSTGSAATRLSRGLLPLNKPPISTARSAPDSHDCEAD
jgi:DNA invertase Pin-like site-specific DNA recombinase